LYNPQSIAENKAVIVNNLTNYLQNTNNLINNAFESNKVYNTAMKQTRDNRKTLTTTTDLRNQLIDKVQINRDSQRTTRFNFPT
jgi:hypothetical protein